MSHRFSRRRFLQTTTALTTAGWAAGVSRAYTASAAEAGETKRPNIVLILMDDMRFDATGLLGHPFLETPNLDALAKNGVVCENAFVTTSLCSPSRACILTGLYAHQHGVLDNVTALPADVPLFPAELQKAGYDTGYFGKWHMGGDDSPQPGFRRWVSFKGQGIYTNPVFNIDGESHPQKGYITDLLTDQAVAFIQQPRKEPFFAYVAHKAVHAEFTPADRHKGCYAEKNYPRPGSMADTEENYQGKPEWVRKQRRSWHGVDGMYNTTTNFDAFVRDYAETMRAVDDSVGRIMDTLKAQGQLDHTLIFVTSDNGFQFGEHGLIDKRTMYEASIRVPMIVHGPGWIPSGARRKQMILNIDIGPTILAAAGLSALKGTHGQSFWEILRDDAPGREDFLYEYFWERSFPQTPTVLGVRTDRYKLMVYQGIWDRYELYDLEKDPCEMKNLLGPYLQQNESGTLDTYIEKNADPEVKALFKEMKKRLGRRLEETGALPEPRWSAHR